MGYERLKKKAKDITRGRSLKPDLLYILYTFFTGVTIIGLPIAYSVMLEYRRYLRLCLKEYDESDSAHKNEKHKLYEFKHPRSVSFEYSIKSAKSALKAVLCLILPGAPFFDIPQLKGERSIEVKVGLIELKMYFIYIFCSAIWTLFLIGLMIFSGSAECVAICAAFIIVMAAVLFKPFVVYCQAYVIYEKQCLDMPEYIDEEEHDEE